ncbi:PepSY domain-containing protein [Geothrix sp. 21YS21S-4]|uniref:PepSY-associated TM helix domain-containing protein n=1 Tax=Geothrix sp. 21YS21S-4 TaxID=3068889 RepID=UPI0027B8A3ED|nr:PepSY-associated TM helix domain-containing protein [Geothrix sp. 21YS21S-4]
MRVDLIRTYKVLHTWTGVLAGMLLFIAFYAGGLTLFKEPLARWASPPSIGAAAVPLADAPALINRALAAHPAAGKDFQLHLKPAEDVPSRLTWREGGDDHDAASGRQYVATLDADGVRIDQARPHQLAAFIDTLHRVVGLPFDNDPSRWFMGVAATLYALALVSGVILLVPTFVKNFFALRTDKGPKRLWLDAHSVVGLASLPFHIVIATTAVVFAFHDEIYDLQNKLIHRGRLSSAWAPPQAPPKPAAPRQPSAMLPPEELLAKVKALSPTFEPTRLQYKQVFTPKAVVQVWGHDPKALSPRPVGGFVALNPYGGEVLRTDFLPGRQDGPNTTIASFFALHFGTYGGAPAKWLYFVLAMGGAWLFYSGNLLWLESRRKIPGKDQTPPARRRDTRALAAATVGVCLGCICGLSLTIAASKGLHSLAPQLSGGPRAIYYSVFFASLAWAFLRGAARASVDLLWVAAAFTLLIPVTTLLAWLFPALGLWAHASAPALGVDLTALAGSLCFAWMARVTSKRVQSGPADSIWSKHSGLPNAI